MSPRIFPLLLAIAFGLVLAGCSEGERGAATATAPGPTQPPQPADLSREALLQGEYAVPDMGGPVKFSNGAHYWVRQPGQTERENPAPARPQENWKTAIDPGLVALGDLDGDGRSEAALVMRSQFGGAGVFVALVVVRNVMGAPVQVAAAPLGDRVAVNSISIRSGEVLLDMLTHAAPDSAAWAGQCCPNVPAQVRFRLAGSALVEVR